TGDTDNSAFTISGNQLQINTTPDFESQSSYSIRVETTDGSGASYQKQLTININDVKEAPTDILLDNITLDENATPNSVVGQFSTTDPDNGDAFTYALVSGTGDTDNSAFTISGNQLQINTTPDFESQSSYSILVETTDESGASYQEQLTININDVNENSPPTTPLAPIPENTRTRFDPITITSIETDSITGILSLGKVFNVTETTESATLSFQYASQNINDQVRFFNSNGLEIGSPITLSPTFENNGVRIFKRVELIFPPNTSSIIIGSARTEIEDIQLIVDQYTSRTDMRIANSNYSLFDKFSPFTEVGIIDNYYLEKDSRQLDIDSLQNQKYMSVQQFNELPQFLLQEVGFEHIDDNGIITI
ncbi:MAG: cadherin repeat domain-containing protein, partial [Trichodesmium sp. St16_bin2-tuft]|nr:cadherin repeat domain-containing protein [Trichodesmium sp. St16_bin2-tuft]